jgi:hypothetical protein
MKHLLDRFSETIQMSNLLKIGPMGAELHHADGKTDGHHEANS